MREKEIKDRAGGLFSDWKERTDEKQRKYTILSIAAFAMAFIICFFLFLWFQNSNYDRIIRQNMNYVQDSAISEANRVEHEMEYAETLILNLSRQYASLYKINGDMSVEDRLVFLSDKTIFDRIAFISPDGIDTSLEGIADVSDRDYFKDAMQGNSGWEMLQKSRIMGKPMVVFYSPIKVDDEIVGVMAGFYGKDRLAQLFSYQLFNFAPDTYLLLGDGTIVASSGDAPEDSNYLDILADKKYEGDIDFNDIKEAIDDAERTTITFRFLEGRKTIIGVVVQFIESDWMLLTLMPNEITDTMAENANRTGAVMLVSLIFVFIILSFILIFFSMQQRKRLEHEISNAFVKLQEAIRAEERQQMIIEALGNIYTSVYYLDLTDSTVHRMKENTNKELTAAIPDDGDIIECFDNYAKLFVAPAYEDAIRNLVDPGTVKERLSSDDLVVLEYQRKDEMWRRVMLIPAERDENNELVSVIFAAQKIDAEKQKELKTKKALEEAYEAARLASNAKTRFLSNMSHDIRTPMNAIVGMTAIAGANLDNSEKVADCLKKITSSSKHLLGLINEVLDMSKIESGKVDLVEDEFNLSDMIGNLVSVSQPMINEKNHNLIVKINNVKHENVIGDQTRLLQVLTNFLSNAIKYTPDNGTIEMYISEKDTNKTSIGWYEIIFKDNGLGMSKEFVDKIFEPFSRANDERLSQIQGTGLGMPIAKNIINMMNGDIKVESELNKGSKFTVSFVLKLQDENEVNYEEFVDLPVLVADDDVDACESTCTILNELSMKSEWVTSGREAVEKVTLHHSNDDDYYAVIVDWKMPDMNGVETAREIRKRIGDDVPIIVISAYDWTDIEQEARKAGVVGFLSKPLFKSRIVSLFSELVGAQKKVDEPTGEASGDAFDCDFTGHRVLLIEDNEINREMAVELFSMVGLETDTAENGKLGVDKFSESAPGYYDLIFMDIQMPVMDGYDATMAIRALDRDDAKRIPIYAMSANAFAQDVRHAHDCGMNGHISKPIDMNRVVKVLKEHIITEE